jgi:hypothetical protein
MPEPINKDLYANVKKKIMASYKKNSAFASGAIVKEYKRLGGKYKEDGKPRPLERWFDEKWIDVNPIIGVKNDKAYPVFRPTIKVNSNTPTILQEIPIERLKEQYRLKQKYKGEKNLPRFYDDEDEETNVVRLPSGTKKGGMIVRKNPFNDGSFHY